MSFGDISVYPSAIYTGNTFHGYAEMRVMLENHSDRKTHIVTLVYPNRPYQQRQQHRPAVAHGKLAPEVREVVSLLQPPLPAQGDSSIRVEVDNRHEGEIHAPNANNHCNFYSRGGQAATVFISRSLDYDAVEARISSEPRRVHSGDGHRSAGCHHVGAVISRRPGCQIRGAAGRQTGWNWIMRRRKPRAKSPFTTRNRRPPPA